MKTYEEKSKSVFDRIEAEREHIKKRNKTVVKMIVSSLCLCGAVIIAIGLFNGGPFDQFQMQPSNNVTIDDEHMAVNVTIENEQPPAIESIRVVDAARYAALSSDCMVAPGPGDVFLDHDVYMAMEDTATDREYFFVELQAFNDAGATRLGTVDKYIYKGKTIAEWRELADLQNEAYPYSEYNRDHGGNVTKEEYDAVVSEAKLLDAIANSDEAALEYTSTYEAEYSDSEKLRLEAINNECSRLVDLGYDAKIIETWTYAGVGEKQTRTVLAGLFTKAQIKRLQTDDASPDIGICLSWMRNGDGIAEFNKTEWKQNVFHGVEHHK